MSKQFGIMSLVTMLIDHHRNYREKPAPRVNYRKYINSPEWKRRAFDAKRRAGFRCQICNEPGHLQAHHRTYERLGHEAPGDITVLCNKCHELYSRSSR
jgi:5-methylcytosine-specific restriction endonuclease McrA